MALVGAVHDCGDVTWKWPPDRTHIVIEGTVLNGLGFETTVTIPAKFGHYAGTDATFLTLPSFVPTAVGNAQLQVTP